MQNKNYPLNQLERITSLRQLIDFRAKETGEKPAFVYMKDGRKEKAQVTYGQLKEQEEQLGTYLFSKGYRQQKIAILGENSYDWILSFLQLSTVETLLSQWIKSRVWMLSLNCFLTAGAVS